MLDNITKSCSEQMRKEEINEKTEQKKTNKASANGGEGAGRGPCGLRNSELGPLPHVY